MPEKAGKFNASGALTKIGVGRLLDDSSGVPGTLEITDVLITHLGATLIGDD